MLGRGLDQSLAAGPSAEWGVAEIDLLSLGKGHQALTLQPETFLHPKSGGGGIKNCRFLFCEVVGFLR